MRNILSFTFLLIQVLPLLAAEPPKNDLGNQIRKLIEPLVDKGFSGCVLIEKGGQVMLREGFGLANQETKQKNTQEMLFDIGSVTKPITAAVILRLVEAKKLTLATTLGDLFKDAPEDKAKITVEQLLAHTSGLPREYDLQNVDHLNRDAITKALLKTKLDQVPGKKYQYSNANYFLLAAVIEIASKQPYEDAVRELVFKPLKLKRTTFSDDTHVMKKETPVRYDDSKALGHMAGWPHGWGHRGATGILSTVDDLAKFAAALHEETLFTEERRMDWVKPRLDNYALGWFVLTRKDRPQVLLHSGAAPGARAMLAHYPDSKTTLVVLMNSAEKGALHEWTILRGVESVLFPQ